MRETNLITCGGGGWLLGAAGVGVVVVVAAACSVALFGSASTKVAHKT